MRKETKKFVDQSNKLIKKGSSRINCLHKEIAEYEAVIDVISRTGTSEMVRFYKEKINQCYYKIESIMDNIEHNREIIATMQEVNKIIERGRKKSA